ncbi:MAG TPA: GNAT family N-acetyltransferase, partial [Anaerolineae bacterium]|nr:GNAT family N-acetyltransferase [Anaerolineae bacterium]
SEPDDRFDIHLWEAETGGEPVAWSHFSHYRTFDLFAHPAAVTPEQRLAMFTWAEEHLAARLRAEGVQRMSTIWISEHDADAIAHLTARGFQRGEQGITFMTCPLDDLGDAPKLAPGFSIRSVAGEHEAAWRAAPQYAAFESSWDMDRYVARYRRFMQSPVYDPELDLVVVAPDGEAAAFAIGWIDDVNRAGHLEPVGTHPAFHRQGLGRAVVHEALRRLAARGMRTATVCPESDSPAAVGLYASAGFRPVHELGTFYRDLA